jgi:hypothetical protein
MELKIPKLGRRDYVGIAVLVLVVAILMVPTYYRPNPDCEVSRPAFKCETAKNVIVENCNYWGRFDCDSTADSSLPQIEWYIQNLCGIHNRYHADKLDCSNLKHACNQVAAQSCPVA